MATVFNKFKNNTILVNTWAGHVATDVYKERALAAASI